MPLRGWIRAIGLEEAQPGIHNRTKTAMEGVKAGFYGQEEDF